MQGENNNNTIGHGTNNNYNTYNNQVGHTRHKGGSGSLDNSLTNDNQLNMSNNMPTAPGSPGASQNVVQLNKKIIGTRKRNAREKSYDSYN